MEKNRLPFLSAERWSQIISDIFSPLLVPTYGMAMAMWMTGLKVLPERSRLMATLIVGIITGLIPLAALLGMHRAGMIDDMAVSDRRRRTLPILIAMLCYIAAAMFLGSARAPMWLRIFFYGSALAAAVSVLVSFKWKISAHTAAMGGLVGLLLWFAVGGLADVSAVFTLSVGILVAGAVASARVVLGRHSLGQVAAGFCLGFLCTFGLTFFFYFC